MFIKIINFDMKKLKRKMREEKEELIEYQIRSLDKTITRKKIYSRKFNKYTSLRIKLKNTK